MYHYTSKGLIGRELPEVQNTDQSFIFKGISYHLEVIAKNNQKANIAIMQDQDLIASFNCSIKEYDSHNSLKDKAIASLKSKGCGGASIWN